MMKRVGEEQNLDRLAEATVRRALDDDYPQAMAAAKEIGDRLDGKPAQAIIGGDEGDSPIRVIAEIRRSIVDPQAPA